MSAGDILYIRGGTYNQTAYISKSGAVGAPLTISGYPGEVATLDGAYQLPGTSSASWWSAMVLVEGSHTVIENFKIVRSNGMGISSSGISNQVRNVESSLNMDHGILITGQGHAIVSDCVTRSNCLSNINGSMSRGNWGGGIGATAGGAYSIFSNNIVGDTWGEGLSISRSSNCVLVANTIYNSYSANVYLQGSHGVAITANLIYYSSDNTFTNAEHIGIELGNEQANELCYSNTIVNNLVLGGQEALYAWMNYGSPTIDTVIAFNTFANATGDYTVKLAVTNYNTLFANNIIVQSNTAPVGFLLDGKGISRYNNLWSKTAAINLQGLGDVTADPLLTNMGRTEAGYLSPNWFRLRSDSPAAGAGLPIPGVVKDFFGNPRGVSPDIGGCSLAAPTPPLNLRVIFGGL